MSTRPGSTLSVFLGNEMLGGSKGRGPSRYRFSYAAPVFGGRQEDDIVLSVSLPVQPDAFAPARTAPFFEGLLPEGAVRAAIARSFRLSEEDGFGLLAALGADCAGAVSILPPGVEPRPPGGGRLRPLDEGQLGRLIEELPRHPLGVDLEPDGVRLSLGGVQHKLVLARADSGQFSQPLDGAPSTCLLKPDFGQYDDLVANEAFCMRVAQAAGLRVAGIEIVKVGSVDCLYVDRFDRVRDRQGGPRIHQGGHVPGPRGSPCGQVRRKRGSIDPADSRASAQAAFGPQHGPRHQRLRPRVLVTSFRPPAPPRKTSPCSPRFGDVWPPLPHLLSPRFFLGAPPPPGGVGGGRGPSRWSGGGAPPLPGTAPRGGRGPSFPPRGAPPAEAGGRRRSGRGWLPPVSAAALAPFPGAPPPPAKAGLRPETSRL